MRKRNQRVVGPIEIYWSFQYYYYRISFFLFSQNMVTQKIENLQILQLQNRKNSLPFVSIPFISSFFIASGSFCMFSFLWTQSYDHSILLGGIFWNSKRNQYRIIRFDFKFNEKISYLCQVNYCQNLLLIYQNDLKFSVDRIEIVAL